ncbi:hypothetical protein BB560_005655 [Smittium megazygosporum]|uniref:N-acetylglucosaminylphosphatidylinositol deacetylase n=1 Tax=Smittium megazygosporum TaxID=133381 RepID=A0A2T9Z1P6_9FUNG|nr:hypothetical protein BB560_005655 [Smittium megazygosporum]
MVLTPKGKNKTVNVMFVTAHPDDETMFFAPTILALSKIPNVSIFLVCFSTGNAMGMGNVRRKELTRAVAKFGIPPENLIMIDDPAFPDDNKQAWDPVLMSKTLEAIVLASKTDIVFTFDKQGVSGHPNHISLYIGIKFMVQTCQSFKFHTVQLYTLDSISLLRKYLLFFDMIFSYGETFRNSKSILFVSDLKQYRQACEIMDLHASQMVWFRKLYIIFSRYMYINSFQRVK